MKLLRPIAVVLALALTGVACGKSQPIPVATAKVVTGLNLIIVADGEVGLKRNGWNDFHPIGFGTALYRGDQLRPSAGAKVIVLCDNLTAWTVPAGAPSGLNQGCPQSASPVLLRGKSAISASRPSSSSGSDPLIPYVISPRATKLLSPKPILRWNPVLGVTSYTVSIRGLDWQETVSATEVVYPGTPALEAGKVYLLIVEADNGRSSRDEGMPDLGFSLLHNEETERIRTDSATIAGINLPDEGKAFALAQLYGGYGLYAEAIEMLEKVADAGSQAANVYRSLGDFYWQIGLSRLAEDRYLQAVNLAEAAGDTEALAAAQTGLGEVYMALGNKSEAVRWLTQAQAGYEALGDSDHVSEVAELLAEISK